MPRFKPTPRMHMHPGLFLFLHYRCYAGALSVGADAIISRDQDDFQESSIRVFDCDGLFRWLEEDHDLIYEGVPF